jgi:2-oxo-4-hydroxy-4-carboxy-5-ureidoimidazoline decarboxylase
MLMHQGIGLDAFNDLPTAKAVHALYECCNSVPMAGDLARGRPYADRDQLFRRGDALLFALAESSVGDILPAYPHIGRRPRSTKSRAEQCAVWDENADRMAELDAAANGYADQFGFDFVMCTTASDTDAVLAAIADRRHNDPETERKVVRIELAKINRTRLERMLGPEGGYQNW